MSTTAPAACGWKPNSRSACAPGTVVDVVGFPAVTPGKPILTNAIFKWWARRPSRSRYRSTAENVLSPENDATLVRMEGHLLSMLMSPRERILVLRSANP